jgi:hypothetical protein
MSSSFSSSSSSSSSSFSCYSSSSIGSRRLMPLDVPHPCRFIVLTLI